MVHCQSFTILPAIRLTAATAMKGCTMYARMMRKLTLSAMVALTMAIWFTMANLAMVISLLRQP